jgi:uncharacterized ferritin-like protein (DUF455 family)
MTSGRHVVSASTCALDAAGAVLSEPDLDRKAAMAGELLKRWQTDELTVGARSGPLVPVDRPGRPARPPLVHPRELPQRKLTTEAGRIAAIHAVTHIEANAINLALDAAHRFDGMPDDYYGDWLSVAADEARHFLALRQRLRDHGADYGDLPAHDGLWAAAVRSADDVLVRMALVPRVLEARGLDVTPAMIDRFAASGDEQTRSATSPSATAGSAMRVRSGASSPKQRSRRC